MSKLDPLVRLENATFRYGRFVAVAGVSAEIQAGEFVGVRGGNGSGKTTLLRAIAGTIPPKSGRRVGRPRCAYVPAAIDPPPLSVAQWIHGMRNHIHDPLQALQQFAFRGELQRPCHTLSFGNLRKVLLAEALCADVEVVVIDEARVGLDDAGNAALDALVRTVRRRGVAVVIAEQDSHPIGVTTQLWRLTAGQLQHVEEETDRIVSATFHGPSTLIDRLASTAQQLGLEQT
jgi:ABC-type multidrug transport system ATPase subunit